CQGILNMVFLVAGGALGAMGRYLIGLGIMKRFPSPRIPVAMLTVNIIGSAGLGLFLGHYFRGIPANAYHDALFLFLGTGFFGAFTTYSTFSVETIQLLQEREYKKAFTYITCSLAGSIL